MSPQLRSLLRRCSAPNLEATLSFDDAEEHGLGLSHLVATPPLPNINSKATETGIILLAAVFLL